MSAYVGSSKNLKDLTDGGVRDPALGDLQKASGTLFQSLEASRAQALSGARNSRFASTEGGGGDDGRTWNCTSASGYSPSTTLATRMSPRPFLNSMRVHPSEGACPPPGFLGSEAKGLPAGGDITCDDGTGGQIKEMSAAWSNTFVATWPIALRCRF